MKKYFCNGKNDFCDREMKNGVIFCGRCAFANCSGGELRELPQTNFEFIKSMSIDELASLLCDLSAGEGVSDGCKSCIAKEYCSFGHNGMKVFLQSEVLKEWLNKEVEE